MYQVLENSLYVKDRKKFELIRERADGFHKSYNGDNIIQDDIFNVVENYAEQKGMPLELLRYPIGDEKFCACTFIRGGRFFILLNGGVPLAKQIFAMGHELYHMWCYLENEDQRLMQNGSMLDSATMEDATNEQEEMEANAFSGLLLVPADLLQQQIRIYGIQTSQIAVRDILMLMDIFAVPYKAMNLRLYEDGLITEDRVRKLFAVSPRDIETQMQLTGRAKRWNVAWVGSERFGSLLENMLLNEANGALPPGRLESDRKRIREIMEQYNLIQGEQDDRRETL